MKLQFTNGYRPRFDQISRLLHYQLSQEERKRIPRNEIVSELGIPDKQIENLTSMMTGFGLVLPRSTKLTPFGKIVIKSDPYFEKIETLWMIHYIVSSNPDWVVWHRIINVVLPSQDQYDVEKISQQYFSDLAKFYSELTVNKKLPKEVGSVFASYTRSELSHLNILDIEKTGNFFKTIPSEIPDLAFLYCLIYYRNKHLPGSSAINIEEICLSENSPGRVFNFPEYKVRTILDNLHNSNLIRMEKMANLDQVRIPDSINQEIVLQQIYGGGDAN